MKLTAVVKLNTDIAQFQSLKETLKRCNAACNYISQRAWESRQFRQYNLHKLVYFDVREQFGLSAQITVRCIAKVADAYKLDKKAQRRFTSYGAIAYDARNLTYKADKQFVTISTIAGRIRIPFVCGERQKQILQFQQGESDLVLRDEAFYLFATCNIEEPSPMNFQGVLGVDMGIVNIAADSDGEVFSGVTVNGLRYRHRKLRSKLQIKGTKSAKKLLKKRGKKERRFATNINHIISKRIVAKAEGTNRAIALEELTGIRSRTKVSKSQRATHSSWAFNQLRQFLEYKAKLKGIVVKLVDPRNTSRTCPICGCVDKRNRVSQSQFSCTVCGFSGLADCIAARIIASRATVNLPNISPAPRGEGRDKLPALAGSG